MPYKLAADGFRTGKYVAHLFERNAVLFHKRSVCVFESLLGLRDNVRCLS